jgi:hypothetical protein
MKRAWPIAAYPLVCKQRAVVEGSQGDAALTSTLPLSKSPFFGQNARTNHDSGIEK